METSTPAPRGKEARHGADVLEFLTPDCTRKEGDDGGRPEAATPKHRNRHAAVYSEYNSPIQGLRSAAGTPDGQRPYSTVGFVDRGAADMSPSLFTSRAQSKARDLRRQTLQCHYQQVRRANHEPGNYMPNIYNNGDIVPPRLSLDSQRTAISNQATGDVHADAIDGYMGDLSSNKSAPWSSGQMRRARRYTMMTHARGLSCPTLDITRIMRSISVSGGGSNATATNSAPLSSTLNRAAGKRSKRASLRWNACQPEALTAPPQSSAVRFVHSGSLSPLLPMSSFSDGNIDDHQLVGARPSLDAAVGVPGSNAGSSTSSSRSSRDGGSVDGIAEERRSLLPDSLAPRRHYMQPAQSDFPLIHTSSAPSTSVNTPLPEPLSADGLRRRISIKQRDVGTPDIAVEDEIVPPISPPLSEATELTHREHAQAQQQRALRHDPANRQSTAYGSSISGSSSERWSTVSAESPHKRYSYSAAAIAEALSRLESASASNGILGDSASKGSEETMTITLKAPGKREGDDAAASSSDSQPATIDSQLEAGHRGSSDSERAADNAVAVPAVYQDGSASLWDQYVAELESSEFDPNIHLKRQRVFQFLHVPWSVEKLLWFGVAICFDALIYVFSILPAKFVRSLVQLAISLAYELPAAIESAICSPTCRMAAGTLPETWRLRLSWLGNKALSGCKRLVHKRTGDSTDAGRQPSTEAESRQKGHITRRLSPSQLFDFYRGLLIIFTCIVLCRIDAAQMYHSIRAQSSLKLYFIFSALDIFDRLLASFGHDALDALQSTTTDPRSRRWKTGAAYFLLAQCYMLIHTLVLFYQVITLNVAVNAYSDQLLSLLISNQFVEIKSNVFKKWEKEMLFQVACADIVERFQQIVFLFIIILRNLAELSGTGLSPSLLSTPTPASANSSMASSSAFAAGTVLPTAQPPVSFDSATPSAFVPLLPAWLSVPFVNRIVTPILMVLGSEILIDWIKHSFITKLNWIRPEIYSHYIDILSRDMACARSGSTAKVVPVTAATAALAVAARVEPAEADENPSGAGNDIAKELTKDAGGREDSDDPSSKDSKLEGTESHRLSRSSGPSSSSALTHVLLKVFSWARSSLLAEPSDHAEGSKSAQQTQDREGTHKRARSVTQPQLFVEQSSKVARRLGLSPMPIACMIILMLMQVLHILVSSSRSHHTVIQGADQQQQQTAADQLQLTSNASWLFAIPLLSTVLRIAAAALRLMASAVSISSLTHIGYVLFHPHALVSWMWPQHSQQQPNSTSPAFQQCSSAGVRACHSATPAIGWVVLDVAGWLVILLIAYALVVWFKLALGNRLMQFAWIRYRAFERRTEESKGTEKDTSNLNQFNSSTRKLDRDQFAEVGKLIGREKSESEWEKQRPKWTLDNIERYSLFKSRVP